MSNLLLLALVALWMTRPPTEGAEGAGAAWPAVSAMASATIFLGGYALLVLGMGLWSRRLARRLGDESVGRSLDRFQRAVQIARYLIIAWLGVGIYGGLHWDATVERWLGRLARFPSPELAFDLPQLLAGIGPALAAWMGLWWAQYPADLALREQTLLVRLNDGLPIHQPPTFGQFFATNLRLQMLFMLVPALVMVFSHDMVVGVLALCGVKKAGGWVDLAVMLPLGILLFILAPELLRRVAHSAPLPAGPLRSRLEAMCRRAGLGYRDVMLWKTRNSMSNAFVMGLFPRVRYVLLSDLLIETMDDRQIEAVFAHELGHVMHRHLWWLLISAVMLTGIVGGPVDLLMQKLGAPDRVRALAGFAALAAGFLPILCMLSRVFERQADVFAARTMQAERDLELAEGKGPAEGGVRTDADAAEALARAQRAGEAVAAALAENPAAGAAGGSSLSIGRGSGGDLGAPPPGGEPAPASSRARPVTSPSAGDGPATTLGAVRAPAPRRPASYVGEYGAGVFAGALRRVADINNIPLSARDWLHPSIAKRVRYLHEMSADPALTRRFDRFMRRVYLLLAAALLVFGPWAFLAQGSQEDAAAASRRQGPGAAGLSAQQR